MGAKDASEKILEAYNDVFADIVNVLLFDGNREIAESDLEEQAPRAYYKADGQLREIERDVAKRWKDNQICIACIGLENQTESDPDAPLRVIGYDGAEYRAQLLRDVRRKAIGAADGTTDRDGKEDADADHCAGVGTGGDVAVLTDAGTGDETDSALTQVRTPRVRYPVVTLVLYYGYEHRWNSKLTLKERLTIQPGLEPYVNDYRINLFEIAYLSREQAAMFRSDFGIVADYCIQMQENGDYVPTEQEITHVQETLHMLSVMTQDDRFEEAGRNAGIGADGSMMERRPRNMCEVLDRIENRGIQKGMERGMERGIAMGEDNVALLMSRLLQQNRYADIARASEDREYRAGLMQEFGIR